MNAYLGASSCHQHGECVPPRRLELRRRPVVQVHITILVVHLGNVELEVVPNPDQREAGEWSEEESGDEEDLEDEDFLQFLQCGA